MTNDTVITQMSALPPTAQVYVEIGEEVVPVASVSFCSVVRQEPDKGRYETSDTFPHLRGEQAIVLRDTEHRTLIGDFWGRV